MEKNTALDRLTALEFSYATIQADIENVAVQARVAGATWEEIGHRLGLSKQTAHARYNEAVKNERKTRYAAADAAGQFTAEEHAKAAQAMEILTTVADNQDAAAASLAQSKILDTDVAGTSETPSIFSDDTAPARAASIHGQRTVEVFQQFAADRAELKATATEDQERADYWEAKRKYVVTVDGAIYSPRGENGWDLHKVLRNVQGRNFQRSYSDTGELIAANEGLIYVSRDKYDGLVQNAAKDRECWIMAATERENTVSARPELMKEIKAMDEKLTAIQQQLKKNRNKKGPDYKTGG